MTNIDACLHQTASCTCSQSPSRFLHPCTVTSPLLRAIATTTTIARLNVTIHDCHCFPVRLPSRVIANSYAKKKLDDSLSDTPHMSRPAWHNSTGSHVTDACEEQNPYKYTCPDVQCRVHPRFGLIAHHLICWVFPFLNLPSKHRRAKRREKPMCIPCCCDDGPDGGCCDICGPGPCCDCGPCCGDCCGDLDCCLCGALTACCCCGGGRGHDRGPPPPPERVVYVEPVIVQGGPPPHRGYY